MNNTEMRAELYFNNAKSSATKKLKAIYEDIYEEAIAQDPSNLAVTIISNESKEINSYIRILREQLKQAAIETLPDFNISENYSEVIWAKVMNTVGVPRVQLCSSERIPASPAEQSSPKEMTRKEYAEQMNGLKKKQMIYGGAALAGVVAETVTLLIVPGFEGVGAVLKLAGLLVVGVGVTGVACTSKSMTEVNRIYTKEKQQQASRESMEAVLREICDKQCECNTKIILKWISEAYEEFVKQCRSYL